MGEFVVMPNHVHGIIIINNPENTNYRNGSVDGSIETLHATSLQSTQSTPPMKSIPTRLEQIQNEFMANISPKSNSLSTIIRSYKSAVSKHAHRLAFGFEWQSRFHDHIIRNEQSYQNISEYIINNPLKWIDDKFNPENIEE
jgi:REP element-mobilizing transposase RayT